MKNDDFLDRYEYRTLLEGLLTMIQSEIRANLNAFFIFLEQNIIFCMKQDHFSVNHKS